MRNEEKDTRSGGNYWSGFFIGAVFGLGIFFLLGTKKGREILKRALELSQEIEEKVSDIADELEERGQEGKKSSKKIEKETSTSAGDNLNSVLKKIKSAMPSKDEVKKYFVKDGKVLK